MDSDEVIRSVRDLSGAGFRGSADQGVATDQALHWIPACAGMTGGWGFGGACSGLGGGVAMSLPEAQPRSVSSYRRRPVPSAAHGAANTWFLDSGLRRNDEQVGLLLRFSGSGRCPRCHCKRRNRSVSSYRAGRYPVRHMVRQHVVSGFGLRRNDGQVGLRLWLFGFRRWCRDVAGKAQPGSVSSYLRRPVPSAAHGAATDVLSGFRPAPE